METLPLDLFQQSADSPALVLFKHGLCNIHWGQFQERDYLHRWCSPEIVALLGDATLPPVLPPVLARLILLPLYSDSSLPPGQKPTGFIQEAN